MPSLTQTEAAERARLIAVERYAVAVDLTDLPTGPEVRCVSTVTFTCAQPGAATFVDCAADVVEATLNGAPLRPAEDGRIALPDLAATNTLVVSSTQSNTTSGEGVHKAVDPADGEVYLWLSFEPDECRHVWACFDQPDLKAPHGITVTAPPAWRVASNTGDPVVTEAGDARTWAFPDTPALSTYNIVVDAGPFHEIRRELGGFDLGLMARRSLAPQLDRDADELFRVTAQGLEFFGTAFAMPFPQRKYDQVFVPDMGGAMENYGCVTWSDAFLSRSAPTPTSQEYAAGVLLHEMAHMWFGNIVTMRWWDDLWLNEAFAEFAAYWALSQATEYVDAWAGLLTGWKLDAYRADQGPATHPIHQTIENVDEAASIFDYITYPKGASALHQLMEYVGEPTFRTGMADYFARHAWGNTTLQDLIDALAKASGRDLEKWRSGWLTTAGVDRLDLEQTGDGLTLVGTGPAGPPRPQVLNVGAYERVDGGLRRTALARVEVAAERTPVDLPAADLYLVNDEDLTFATTRPDAATRDALFTDAALLPTPISRAVAVATAWDMLQSGDAGASEVVGCLTRVALAETAPTVVEPYLRLAASAADLWSPIGDRAGLLKQVAATCRTLSATPERRQEAQRFLAATSADADELRGLLDAAGEDSDLRWRTLGSMAALGVDVSADVAAGLERDPDPDAWAQALAVRAATPTAEAKAEAWEHLAVARDLPFGALRAVARGFWVRGQEQVLAPYAARYLALLPELHRGGMIPAMAYSTAAFPVVGVDPAFLEEVVTASTAAAPVVHKSVLERADEVRRMLVARG